MTKAKIKPKIEVVFDDIHDPRCQSCGSDNFRLVAIYPNLPDGDIDGGPMQVVRCLDCGDAQRVLIAPDSWMWLIEPGWAFVDPVEREAA